MGRGSVVLPIAGMLCCLGLGGTAWVSRDQAPVRERLARFVADVEAVKAAARREAVYGDTLPGNAWEHYVAASEALAPWKLGVRQHPEARDRLQFVQREQPLAEDVRCDVAPALAAALQAIRAGVRCEHAQWQRRLRCNWQGPLAPEAVVDDAMDAAFAAGDVRLLAELYVDRFVFRADVWVSWIDRPVFRDEWLHALDRDTAAWFASVLQRVDERLPIAGDARRHIACAVTQAADRTMLEQSFTMGMHAWRYGCDWYWRELVLCDRLVASLDELEPPALPWSKRQAQLEAFGSVIGDDGDGSWAAKVTGFVRNEERQQRRVLANLRVLRLAVAFVHSLELLRLDDPLGDGPLDIDVRGDEATFRSEGMNGKQRIERRVRRSQ